MIKPTDFKRKPKVCRFVLFEPSIVTAKPTDYSRQESTKAEGEEEPKEPLDVVPR